MIETFEKMVEVIEKTKKPLQFPLKIASFTTDKVLIKNVVNAINIFDVNGVTFKFKELSNNFSIEKDNSLRFVKSLLYFIYVNIDVLSFILIGVTRKDLSLKY